MTNSADSPDRVSVEWDAEGRQVVVHGSREALLELARCISSLASAPGNEHYHLMTPDWGGQELSSDQQSLSGELVNHVKLMLWNDDDEPSKSQT